MSARVELHRDGGRKSVTHVDDLGRLSNTDPSCAKEIYRSDGSTASTLYAVDGRFHRIGGPAVEHFHAVDGSRGIAEWRLRGVLSRIDGPAWVQYDADGALLGEIYALHGQCYDNALSLRSALIHLDAIHLHDEIRNSIYARILAENPGTEEAIVAALVSEVTSVEGVRAVAEGSPVEWAQAYEEAGS